MLTHSFTVPKYFIPFIGITLLGICFGFLGSEQAQNTLSILGILSIGILHGANDLKIIAKKSSQDIALLLNILLIFGILASQESYLEMIRLKTAASYF